MRVAAIIAVLLFATPAHAMSGMCWLVDFYVKAYGEDDAYEYAKRNRWTDGKINAACRCLNYRPAKCAVLRGAAPASPQK